MESLPITEVTNIERDETKLYDLKSATKSVGKVTEPATTGSATKTTETEEVARTEETHAEAEVKPVEAPVEAESTAMEQEEVREVREEAVAEDTNLGKRPASEEPLNEDPETAEPALEKKVKPESVEKTTEEAAPESH